MGAYIISTLIEICTILICLFIIMANGMSDASPQSGMSVWPTFIGGTIFAGLILASHWLPHIGW